MKKVVGRLYAGLGYNYKRYNFRSDDEKTDTLLTANQLNNSPGNSGLTYKLDWDTRDNIFFPYHGYFASLTGYQYFESESGANDDYFNVLLNIRGFWSLDARNKHILAAKLYMNFLSGTPNPANFSYYGRVNGDVQRGYQSGRRADKNALNIELEYRMRTKLLNEKLGFTALIGNGKVYGFYNDFNEAEWLPVVGAGVRYSIFPYERINIRFDATYSKDDFIWYFGIREAF